SRPGPNDVIPPHGPAVGWTPDACLPPCGWRFVLGAPHNVKRVFRQQGSSACFSIAACTWHCYSTPPTHGAHHNQTDPQRDDLCRLSRVLRPFIHEPIPSPSSLSGTLTVCTSVIRRSFGTSWLGPGRSLGQAWCLLLSRIPYRC